MNVLNVEGGWGWVIARVGMKPRPLERREILGLESDVVRDRFKTPFFWTLMASAGFDLGSGGITCCVGSSVVKAWLWFPLKNQFRSSVQMWLSWLTSGSCQS